MTSKKYYVVLIILGILIGCSEQHKAIDKKELSDSLKTSIINQLDTSTHYLLNLPIPDNSKNTNVADNQWRQIIYASEEEFIETNNADTSRHWIRILYKPTFSNPVIIILENKNARTYLKTKITNGQGGYNSGYLKTEFSQILSDSSFKMFSKRLNDLGFSSLKQDTSCYGGYDGTTIYFESVDNGKYSFIARWEPLNCGDTATRQLGQIATDLYKLGKVTELKQLSIENGL